MVAGSGGAWSPGKASGAGLVEIEQGGLSLPPLPDHEEEEYESSLG